MIPAERARPPSATDIQPLLMVRKRNLSRMQRRIDIQVVIVNLVVVVGPVKALLIRVRILLVDVFVRVEGDIGVRDCAVSLLRWLAWSCRERDRVDGGGN